MPNTNEDAEQLEHIAGLNANWFRHWVKQLAVSYKDKHIIAMWPSNLIPGDLPKEIENLSCFKNLHTNI